MKKLKSIGKNKEDLLRNKIGQHTFYLLPNLLPLLLYSPDFIPSFKR